MRRFLLSANLLLLALMLPPSSRADVLYTYSAPVSASGSYDAHSWSFIEPGFLTSDTTVNASNLHSGGTLHSSVGDPTITLTAVSIHSPSSMNFVVQEIGADGAQTSFSDGPLNHYGTYQKVDYTNQETGSPVYDTLVLSPVTSSVPEPASLPLLAGGTLVAIIGVLRGKLRG
jgi:hypothetical protein